MIITNVKTRQYIYGILLAAGGLGVIYGFITNEQLSTWLVLGSAVLGLSNGLALANTSNGKHEAE